MYTQYGKVQIFIPPPGCIGVGSQLNMHDGIGVIGVHTQDRNTHERMNRNNAQECELSVTKKQSMSIKHRLCLEA